jgi:hypothetical protein
VELVWLHRYRIRLDPREPEYVRLSFSHPNLLISRSVSWFLEQSSRVPMIQHPWKPDGGKDLSAVWTKRGGKTRQATENRTLAKPNALMFYHIPIEETYSTPDVDVKSGKPLNVGEEMDPKGNPTKNGGMFENGLMKAHENELGGREVKVVANGHCHGAPF